jgi:hypothetical protein
MTFRTSKCIVGCVILKMFLIKGSGFFLFIIIRYVAVDLFVCQKLDIATLKVAGIKAPGNVLWNSPKIFFRLKDLGL